MKKYRRITAWVLIILLMFMDTGITAAYAMETSAIGTKRADEVQAGEQDTQTLADGQRIIIKYKDGIDKGAFSKNISSSMSASRTDFIIDQSVGSFAVCSIGKKDDMQLALEELAANDCIEYVQPDYKLDMQSVSEPESFTQQWGLYNSGQTVEGHEGRAGVDGGFLDAWDISMGSGVVIGILDTGMDTSHEALSGQVYMNRNEIPGNGKDDDGNGYIDDISGWDFINDDATVYHPDGSDEHGTGVAGIIAGSVTNGSAAGGAPEAVLLPLRFMEGNRGYTSDALKAIEYAEGMGADIINCSFGGTVWNRALYDAIAESSMLFICAAGNRGQDMAEFPTYPAAYGLDNIISVAAIDSKGVMAPFSTYGESIDIAAPGTDIYTAVPGNGYGFVNGTSAAAAFVTAGAALIKGSSEGSDNAHIKKLLMDYAETAVLTEGKISSGRLDAYGALTGIKAETDAYTGEGNDNELQPVSGEGNTDEWYTMDELASGIERFHYGEGGVQPASGNYSVACMDMGAELPNLSFSIGRTYNSRNRKDSMMGCGWTFSFEGRLIQKSKSMEAGLPDGSTITFTKVNGTYIPQGIRAEYEEKDGMRYVRMRSGTSYGYNRDGRLTEIADRYGNKIVVTYRDNKVSKVTDPVGRSYDIASDRNGRIIAVTDWTGRKVSYGYSGNLLTSVTDPEGNRLTYDYDREGYLTILYDSEGNHIQELTYSHNQGNTANRVISCRDVNGMTWKYDYRTGERKTIITAEDGRSYVYWYDCAGYTVRVQYPDGKHKDTEYWFDNSRNHYYCDLKSVTDEEGNRTEYEVDGKGNTTAIRQPDGGIRRFTYDSFNNCTGETDVNGMKTVYSYSADGIRLLSISTIPSNGTEAVTVALFTYHDACDADGNNSNLKGLKATETNGEGETAYYTYDAHGNMVQYTDAVGNKTGYSYDSHGWKLSETTPSGYKSEWVYDRNGNTIEEIQPDGGRKLMKYDSNCQLVKEITAEQFRMQAGNTGDSILYDEAVANSAGTTFTYDGYGRLSEKMDVTGQSVKYAYDRYGNKVQEKGQTGQCMIMHMITETG